MRFHRTTLFRLNLLLTAVLISLAGCGPKGLEKNHDKGKGKPNVSAGQIKGTRILAPEDNQQFPMGEQILVKLERLSDTLPEIDSIEFYLNGKKQYTSYDPPFEYSTESRGQVGNLAVRILGFYGDGRKEYHNLNLIITSDLKPQLMHYKVVNEWPHDPGAYTQGLIYEDGFLFEGTGQWTESSLRKTVIKTGEPVRMLNLPDDVFGEGITIFDNKIYQLTYKSQVGFVYDKESFKRIQKVYYENREGWGLTHDGKNLIMSDGSHRVYFLDPEYFTEVRQLEVFDDKGAVSQLNELEYIEGRIFANIYGTEEIKIIDPESGKVTGRLNMQGLLKEEDRHRRIDVFNGIAWNPETRMLFVTGKYWPKLFEIKLQEPLP